MDDRTTRRAWESFVDAGLIESCVREPVAESWKRSSSYSLELDKPAATIIEEAELFRRRAESNAFLHAAQAAMNSSREFLADADSMMILTDASGVIIETQGDERIIDSAHIIHAIRGGRWAEEETGTNGVGTALTLGRPVLIHGAEHFCPNFQTWACAGSPVKHPGDGEVMGSLVVAGMASRFNPQSLALAVMASEQVRAEVARAMQYDHAILLRNYMGKRPRWSNDELIVVDRRGMLVHASERAMQALVRMNENVVEKGAIAELKAAPFSTWGERLTRIFPQAAVDLVEQDGEGIGAMLVLKGRQRSRSQKHRTAMHHRERSVDVSEILGESPAIRNAKDQLAAMADSDAPILLSGETGVGKELFARAVHGLSAVSDGPFVPLNCGAVPRELMASELFGYAKGAFTGAHAEGRTGKMEAADGGVLCLDEIGELPLDLQPALLRVLDDHVVYPVGSHEPRQANVRLIAMTNRALREEVAVQRFRADLYFRIAVLELTIPPLRERGDDVLVLAEHFARRVADRLERPVPALSTEVERLLRAYPWPGNVRELRNAIERMVSLSGGGHLEAAHLPEAIREFAVPGGAAKPCTSQQALLGGVIPPGDLKSLERASIEATVQACGGNMTKAAKQLGIARSTLYQRMAAYEAAPDRGV